MRSKKPEELDVDIRFLLANERTLLAWIRTGLAVEAGGLALSAVHRQQAYVGVVVMLLGAAATLIGYHRFRSADRAIRRGSLPPTGIGPALQVYGIVSIAVTLAILQFTVLR